LALGESMFLLQMIITKFRDLIKPNEKNPLHPEAAKLDQQNVFSDDQELDEILEEDMVEIEPVGHQSKSREDKNLH
jgi:hypothetical protein